MSLRWRIYRQMFDPPDLAARLRVSCDFQIVVRHEPEIPRSLLHMKWIFFEMIMAWNA